MDISIPNSPQEDLLQRLGAPPWALSCPGNVDEVVKALHRECDRGAEYGPLVLVDDWNATRPDSENNIEFRADQPLFRPVLSSAIEAVKWLLVAPCALAYLCRLLSDHNVAFLDFQSA